MNSKLPQKNKTAKQPAKQVEAEIIVALDDEVNSDVLDDLPPLPPPLSLLLPKPMPSTQHVPVSSTQCRAPNLCQCRAPNICQCPALNVCQCPALKVCQCPALKVCCVSSTQHVPVSSSQCMLVSSHQHEPVSNSQCGPVSTTQFSMSSTQQLPLPTLPDPQQFPLPPQMLPTKPHSTLQLPPTADSQLYGEAYYELFDMYLLPPDRDISTVTNKVDQMQQELSSLKSRICALEEKLNSPSTAVNTDQKSAILKMILADKGMGWRVAMRKVLQMTFGTSTLAASCAVGCKHAKTTSPDVTKLDTIKLHIYDCMEV